MFVAQRVVRALEEKRAALKEAAARSSRAVDQYRATLERLQGMSARELDDLLGGVQWPGGRPTPDLDRGGAIVPFGAEWPTAQDARTWALERLRGVPTVAVDGSQIAASKEFGVPISLVQVGWFENPHDGEKPYVKDVRNEVLAPDDPPRDVEEYAFAESKVNQCRFAMEMQVATERLLALDPGDCPVVFVDGALVLSFAGRMPPQTRDLYLHALFRLLEASLAHRVPVVGYVDTSYASDLATMLRTAFELPSAHVYDASLLSASMTVFDRTAAFRCARGDVLQMYRTEERDYSADICFVYVKTGASRWPARLEFPRWIVDAGLLDHVIDIVRAEVVVGGGYPYALETADAAAVLSMEDRLAFFRLWHEYARDAGLDIAVPGKSVSKVHRR